jgi:hypothetical protein
MNEFTNEDSSHKCRHYTNLILATQNHETECFGHKRVFTGVKSALHHESKLSQISPESRIKAEIIKIAEKIEALR